MCLIRWWLVHLEQQPHLAEYDKETDRASCNYLMLLSAWQLDHIDHLSIRSRRGKRITIFLPWSWYCWLELDCLIEDYSASHAAGHFVHSTWRCCCSLLVLLSVLELPWWGGIEVKGHEESTRSTRSTCLFVATERLSSFSYWKLQDHQSTDLIRRLGGKGVFCWVFFR